MKKKIQKELQEHNRVVKEVINKQTSLIENAANLILESLRQKGKIVLFGNGVRPQTPNTWRQNL